MQVSYGINNLKISELEKKDKRNLVGILYHQNKRVILEHKENYVENVIGRITGINHTNNTFKIQVLVDGNYKSLLVENRNLASMVVINNTEKERTDFVETLIARNDEFNLIFFV